MGRVIVAGAGRMTVPITDIPASDLAVGTVVKLMEGNAAVEYLVINQGIPENSRLYDSSCNGTWLLRKNCYNKQIWANSIGNGYDVSNINTYLNSTFFNALGSVEQSIIKIIQLPYCNAMLGRPIYNMECKIFLLAMSEVGATDYPVDGYILKYFEGSSATNRIAYLDGTAVGWWSRSIDTSANYVGRIDLNGNFGANYPHYDYGIRPALILPSTAKFDTATMLLKG